MNGHVDLRGRPVVPVVTVYRGEDGSPVLVSVHGSGLVVFDGMSWRVRLMRAVPWVFWTAGPPARRRLIDLTRPVASWRRVVVWWTRLRDR